MGLIGTTIKLGLGGTAFVLLLRALSRTSAGSKVLTAAQRAAFRRLAPERSRPYLDAIFATEDSVQGQISSLVLWALLELETRSGTADALDVPGPSGTGDFGARDPAKWGMAMPPDGRGWGRGLWQIDYGSHREWLETHDWTDPVVNCGKAVSILIENWNYLKATPTGAGFKVKGVLIGPGGLPDPRPLGDMTAFLAMIAGYNCGRFGVLLALAQGLDVDTYTTPFKRTNGATGYSKEAVKLIAPIEAKL